MPSEAAIAQMIDIFTDVIDLGGVEERTTIVPNLSVIDAAPTGLTNFIVIQDDRDGDNILAKTVPGVVYANNDKVNVLFIRGGEPIAFQQGSESTNAGLWQIVPSTSTDIYYDGGNVGIGKSVAPDASLEILGTAQVQLRLTHTEDTKFVNFTLDTNHDLTITPSSTGQVIFQPTTDQTNFFQVLDADGGTPVLSVDSVNERVGIGIAAPGQPLHIIGASNEAPQVRIGLTSAGYVGLYSTANHIGGVLAGASHDGADFIARTTTPCFFTQVGTDGSVRIFTDSGETVGVAFTPTERMRINSSGDVGVGIVSPGAQLHIDQPSTTAAQPVLYLDQADISEEMIEFATTIGVGNAIEAVGAKVLTTTHFIKVTLPGALTRYFPVGTIA